MTAKTRPMTADELLRMPRDGQRYELIRGELTRMAPANAEHGWIAVNVSDSISPYVRSRDLGRVGVETGFIIESNPDTARAPDVSFVSRERVEEVMRLGRQSQFWHGAPDLAVEVISPNDRLAAVERKAEEWIAAGARMVVVANPRNRTVRVYAPDAPAIELGEDGVIEGGDVIPGWSMPVRDVFR